MMSEEDKSKVLDYMNKHNICSLATVRGDGFPQVNTVEYVNDDLILYFATDPNSQKINNIKQNSKVSLTIDEDYPDWSKIQGISLGGNARILSEEKDIEKAAGLYLKKFPFVADFPETELSWIEVTPCVISWLDYTVEFGHHVLVEV
jgi:general stress protein 26